MADQSKNNKKKAEKNETDVGPRRPLLRSKDNRVLWGVAGGLAEHIGFSPTLVRLAFVVISEGLGIGFDSVTLELLFVTGICALFVAMAVARLGMYTAYDTTASHTEGIQTTLAATICPTGPSTAS